MSHFTHMETYFQNISYLEKALNRLNIKHKRQNQDINDLDYETHKSNIIINQLSDVDVMFHWNGKKYELVTDIELWQQSHFGSVNQFTNKIAQEYAGELIIGEMQIKGFEPVTYKQNNDGSKTLVIERWNEDKS